MDNFASVLWKKIFIGVAFLLEVDEIHSNPWRGAAWRRTLVGFAHLQSRLLFQGAP